MYRMEKAACLNPEAFGETQLIVKLEHELDRWGLMAGVRGYRDVLRITSMDATGIPRELSWDDYSQYFLTNRLVAGDRGHASIASKRD